MDKLDQIALQILCASINKYDATGFTDRIHAAYHQAKLMLKYRENMDKQWAEEKERRVREEAGDIRFNPEVTVRTANCLYVQGIYSFQELTNYTERDLLKIPNLGRKAINEIKQLMEKRGLSLKNA